MNFDGFGTKQEVRTCIGNAFTYWHQNSHIRLWTKSKVKKHDDFTCSFICKGDWKQELRQFSTEDWSFAFKLSISLWEQVQIMPMASGLPLLLMSGGQKVFDPLNCCLQLYLFKWFVKVDILKLTGKIYLQRKQD